jgi:branched-chain amino acid transport system permease protein
VLQQKRFTYPLLLALAIAAPLVIRSGFYRELLVLAVIFGILALSLDLIMGQMGQFSFGHAAFFGLGAYTTGLLNLNHGVSPWLGFLAAFAFSGIVGFLLALVSLRSLRGFYLALVTLGFATIVYLVVPALSFAGGPLGLFGIASPVIDIPGLPETELRSPFSYYYLVLGLLLFSMYLIHRLLRSRFGRALIALRENEWLANTVGVSSFRHFVIVFTLACALAGLSGAAYAHFVRIVSPETLGLTYMFQMLLMVLVGGTGTMWGPILGAFIFIWGFQLLPELGEFRHMIFGLILLLVIVFMPKGAYPRLAALGNRLIVRRE